MELTDQQRQAVRDWLAAGASLSDVQRSLKSEFNLTMTYMDVRLLVLDIGASVKDKPEPKSDKPEATPPLDEDPYDGLDEEEPGLPPDGASSAPGEPSPSGATKVSLTLDRLVVPGAMISGSVTFSDGVKARWLIDQYGRFGLEPEKPGYRPSNDDLLAFQTQLRGELRRHGYA